MNQAEASRRYAQAIYALNLPYVALTGPRDPMPPAANDG